jgi:hypothetical protein
MSTTRWFDPIRTFFANPWVRGILLMLYYLAIILGLIMLYGKGDFSTPKFIYQGF